MQLTGKVLPFDHKTVFMLLSWLTFGVLLLGRHIRGWRGRVALRWTLTGFAFLILAYTGSRFVLEVILHRSEEHTSELQSLMRISYAVFCLKKKKNNILTMQTKHNNEQHLADSTTRLTISNPST